MQDFPNGYEPAKPTSRQTAQDLLLGVVDDVVGLCDKQIDPSLWGDRMQAVATYRGSVLIAQAILALCDTIETVNRTGRHE